MADVEVLKKQKITHLKLELPLEELKRLMEFWFNNPDSDYNVGKNFLALQQKHDQYLTKIDEFVQTKLNLPNSLAEIENELQNLHRPQDDLAKALGDVVVAEQSFAYSLDTLISGLQINKSSLEKIINEANYPELKSQFDEMLKAIQSWIDKTAYTKTYVLELGRKRALVFGIVNSRIVLALENKFVEISGQKLEDIKGQINAILLARDLLIDIENWWFNAVELNGFSGGYLSKYLQFEKPLLIMRSDYAQGLRFEQNIDSLSDLPPATKIALKDQLQERLNTLKTEIDKLTSGGWQSLLDRQKFLVQERERRISSFPSTCKVAINEYKSKSDNVQTLLEFREVEESYRKIIEFCQTQSGSKDGKSIVARMLGSLQEGIKRVFDFQRV